MAVSSKHLLQAVAGASGTRDSYIKNTVMLLHGDGTNGTQNTTITDRSSNNWTTSISGDTGKGSFTPYGSLWSNYFDGSSNIVGSLSSALGTGDFTVEFWVYIVANTGTGGEGGFLQTTSSSTGLSTSEYGSTSLCMVRDSGTNTYNFVVGSTSVAFSNSGTYPRQWMHIACVRSSGTARIYLNGVLNSTPTTATTNLTGTYIGIGGYYNGNYLIDAYISNFRVTNTVVYSGDFTPPTTPLTAISGTLFLGCQSNRFLNTNSGAAMTINTGAPYVTRFSPFSPTTEYTPSNISGSIAYDSSVNKSYTYVGQQSAFNIAANQAFTAEAWVYPLSGNEGSIFSYMAIISAYENDWGWEITTTGVAVRVTSVGWYYPQFPTNPRAGEWNHVAIKRDTDGTLTAYLNGVAGTPVAGSTAAIAPYFQGFGGYPSLNTGCNTANWTSSGNLRGFKGYITDVRYVVGTAITPPSGGPSSPVSTVTNTVYHLKPNDAGIVDDTGNNNLLTTGNAQISTTQKKYGTASIYFDGNGDYLTLPDHSRQLFRFGTGDFTIEFWAWKSANGTNSYDGVIGSDSNGNAPSGFAVELSSTRGFVFYNDSNVRISYAMNPNDSTWHHYACVRSNGTMALYKDGVQLTTASYAGDLLCNSLVRIGTLGTTSNFNGYIDDLRVTRGVARYTGAFTPPTKTFSNT